jgi:TldD protein
MLEKNDLQEVLEIALKKGGDFAEIYLEQKTTTGVACEADKIERIVTGNDVGGGIRVITGENTLYAFTNDLSKKGLIKVAEVISRAVQGTKKDLTLNLEKANSAVNFPIIKRPEDVSIDSKVDVVKKANNVARSIDERIKQVTVSYSDVVQNITVANSEGVFVEDERIRTRLVVNAVAAENGQIQTGYEAVGGHAGFEYLENNQPEELANQAVGRALLMLEAKPAPAGKMPVVMAGEAGGTMVHEACGHGLEADLVQKQLSVYGGKKGQKVASDLITVIDNGTLGQKYGSFRFDDEGTPSQKNILIENGILKDYMYDYLTAKKEGRNSTGNGRRESYQDRPIPRMTNTLIAPGKDKAEDIVRNTKHGLLVKKMGGGQVNTTTGDFVFEVTEGYLIEDGKITVPVRGATLTGNGPQALTIVDAVGGDLGFAIGTCGKDGQGVPVSDAQPTLRIPELVVGGILD